jgi:hypothetical protein
MDSGAGASVSTLKNSIFHQGDRDERIRWSSSYIGNLSYIQSATAQGANSFNTDPKFTEPNNNNFHLQAESPAIDTGIAHEVYTTFYNTYRLSIARDPDNITRPTGERWDIGAHEFSELTPALPAPTLPAPTFKEITM